MYDNPVGQLAWMGEKWISCMCIPVGTILPFRLLNDTYTPLAGADATAGHYPSVLTHNEILRSISLTYLTDTFMSSIYTYAQDPSVLETGIRRAKTDAPMLVTFFRYSIGFWPEVVLQTMGNLVMYRRESCPYELEYSSTNPRSPRGWGLFCWFGEPA
jgi:hypothetical protein